MPLIQKIIQIGDSKAVTIPKSWLTFHEIQNMCPIKEVTVEVNGALIIRPIMTLGEKKNEKQNNPENVTLCRVSRPRANLHSIQRTTHKETDTP